MIPSIKFIPVGRYTSERLPSSVKKYGHNACLKAQEILRAALEKGRKWLPQNPQSLYQQKNIDTSNAIENNTNTFETLKAHARFDFTPNRVLLKMDQIKDPEQRFKIALIFADKDDDLTSRILFAQGVLDKFELTPEDRAKIIYMLDKKSNGLISASLRSKEVDPVTLGVSEALRVKNEDNRCPKNTNPQ